MIRKGVMVIDIIQRRNDTGIMERRKRSAIGKRSVEIGIITYRLKARGGIQVESIHVCFQSKMAVD